MYGLPHAGLIEQQLLKKRLEKHGYGQSNITPGFWKYDTRPISFTLTVNDFGVMCIGTEHADHLINDLKEHCEVAEDWDGTEYCGITLDWDYIKRLVHLSMPCCCDEALARFCHELHKIIGQPHKHALSVYGGNIQYTKAEDKSTKLEKVDKLFIQQITGTSLYHARDIDGTMLVALSVIALERHPQQKRSRERPRNFWTMLFLILMPFSLSVQSA